MAENAPERLYHLVVTNWPMKLTALLLASVLWAAVAAQEPATQRIAVALQVSAPEGRPLTQSLPRVYGVFNGPARELLKMYASPPVLQVSIPDTTVDSVYTVQIAAEDVDLAKHAEVRAIRIEPRAITFTLENVARRTVPVVPRISVWPDSGFAISAGIAVTPESVLVVGPEHRLREIRAVSTLPIELSGVNGPVSRSVQLDTSGLGSVRLARRDVAISTEIVAVVERVLMGIPVNVQGERGGSWSSEPPAVIVTVRGPAGRVVQLTRDSVDVAALPHGTGQPETVRLQVVTPRGVEGTAMPDTAVVQRRSRG